MTLPEAGLASLLEFPFVQTLFGRRSRRFAYGATLPDGPLAFTSPNEPLPLTEAEEALVLLAISGTTGWNFGIMRHERYAPHLSNYAGAASGRTFPSAAGFHTAEIFFTNDSGTFFVPTRDAPPELGPDAGVEELLTANQARVRKLSGERLHIPPAEPYMEGHNTWIANCPGSTLFIPVGDVAQHTILNLCFFVQNGYCIFDDVSGKPIEGMERFADIVDVEGPYPLSFVEQYSLTELTAELATSCYAGVLMLTAMGLGGWMFDGIDNNTVLGASLDPDVPGLGFRYDEGERFMPPLPNPTGLEGVYEAFCPPHYADMRAAVEAVVERKFGEGGPYNSGTPGPWRETPAVRGSAVRHDDHFVDCVAVQAQHILDTHGKFPGTVPTLFIMNYVQAHHLELAFYDEKFGPGAYLDTHARHMERWH